MQRKLIFLRWHRFCRVYSGYYGSAVGGASTSAGSSATIGTAYGPGFVGKYATAGAGGDAGVGVGTTGYGFASGTFYSNSVGGGSAFISIP